MKREHSRAGWLSLVSAMALVLISCTSTKAPFVPSRAAPEPGTGQQAKQENFFTNYGLVTAHPLATQAGLEILDRGGNAIDATVAAQMTLNLVEPQSSGIGGGAFLMYYDGAGVYALDGRETAPVAADSNLFRRNGKLMDFWTAVVGGRSVGTPGTLRMLSLAHQRFGKLEWAALFEPAIRYASEGFAVTPRLHNLLKDDRALRDNPRAREYFYQPDGEPWPVGHILRNPAFADILRRIASNGAQAFYQGEVASAIVDAVHSHPTNPGLLSQVDLQSYRSFVRDPICQPVDANQESYLICGFPPPSSGVLTMAQIIGIMDAHPFPIAKFFSGEGLHVYTEASRLAYADRARYMADPDYVPAPGGVWENLLDPTYLRARASLIGSRRMAQATAGTPPGAAALSWAPMPDQQELGTSHLSVVDSEGHAVSMTTTIESGFGSRLMVGLKGSGGFLLNNELTDFSFAASDKDGRLIANRVEPGKRPRSSMNPLLIFRRNQDGSRGELYAVLGSPGGSAIIHYTARTVIGLLYRGLSPQEVVNEPNIAITSPNGEIQLEEGVSEKIISELQALGHQPQSRALVSGLQVLQRYQNGWRGGSDPRREGVVKGR